MEENTAQLISWLRPGGPAPVHIPTTTDAWMSFTERVCQSALAGLILESVARAEVDVPQLVQARLRATSVAVAAANIHIAQELERVIGALNRAGIPVMVLKGAALNLGVYDRPDLRPTGDVDLLVHPKDAAGAVQALTQDGCSLGAELLRDDFFPLYRHETELFSSSSNPIRIDLHVRPFCPLRLSRIMPDDAMWDGASEVRVGEAVALVPSAESMLLHLAGHAAFHGCARILWQYDIMRFVEHCGDTLNWRALTVRADEWGIAGPVLTALEKTAGMFGRVAPDEALERLRSVRHGWKDRLAFRQAPRDAASPVGHFLVNLLCTPGLGFRLHYAVAVLTPNRRHLGEVYPFRHCGWVPLAHFWRFLRPAWRVAAGLWRRVLGPATARCATP